LHFKTKKIKGQGVVNEGGFNSIRAKGIPNLAEELQIARNLFLLEYTGGKLHIPNIYCKISSINQRRKAKGLQVAAASRASFSVD
jgi:dihydroorotase